MADDADTTEVADTVEETSTVDGENTVLGDDQTTTSEAADEAGDGSETEAASGEKSEAAKKPADAPAYTEFKLPPDVPVDEATLGEFTELASESHLTQEQAQKFVDMGLKVAQARLEASTQAWQESIDGWTTDVNKLPRAVHEQAKTALSRGLRADGETAVTAEDMSGLRTLLNDTGLGNHPVLVKVLANLGRAFREDGPATSGREAARERTVEERLYPNHPPG